MQKRFLITFGVLLLTVTFACQQQKPKLNLIQSDEIFQAGYVKDIMQSVFEYQRANPGEDHYDRDKHPNGWVPSAFYTGVISAYHSTQDSIYLKEAMQWAESCDWQPAPRLRHADDHSCGSVYLELYEIYQEPHMLNSIKATFDSLIATKKPGREDWWWCDALYMAPPTIARLGHVTGEQKYYDYLHEMWWDCTEYLYDEEEHLYYRDDSYFDKKTENGKKIFWSRGNGWVAAGTARVLDYLPEDDPMRPKYIKLHQEMAAKIASIQGEDGLWRTSLLDYDEFPLPETSGTGFYCFALAWGINNGTLDAEKYLPHAKKAWRGLVSAVFENGKLGWVQQIGADPRSVKAEDTQAYAAGAFLLSGGEMLKLREKGLL